MEYFGYNIIWINGKIILPEACYSGLMAGFLTALKIRKTIDSNHPTGYGIIRTPHQIEFFELPPIPPNAEKKNIKNTPTKIRTIDTRKIFQYLLRSRNVAIKISTLPAAITTDPSIGSSAPATRATIPRIKIILVHFVFFSMLKYFETTLTFNFGRKVVFF
jgi:hypothetical protein